MAIFAEGLNRACSRGTATNEDSDASAIQLVLECINPSDALANNQ
jgi:hypothetical protein